MAFFRLYIREDYLCESICVCVCVLKTVQLYNWLFETEMIIFFLNGYWTSKYMQDF